MAKAKINETKAFYEGKTAIELQGEYSNFEIIRDRERQMINDLAIEITQLDPLNKNYISRLKDKTASMKSLAADLEYTDSLIQILGPMLEAKIEQEQRDNEMVHWEAKNHEALRPLMDLVEEMKEKAKDSDEWLEAFNYNEEMIDRYHDDNLAQLTNMIKQYVGDLKEIHSLRYNQGRGFDGIFIGTKASISINTILAWGPIVRPHYRTLVRIN